MKEEKREYKRRGQSTVDLSLELDIRKRLKALQLAMLGEIADKAEKSWGGDMPKWRIIEIMRAARAKWYPEFSKMAKELGELLITRTDARSKKQIIMKLKQFGLSLEGTGNYTAEAAAAFREQIEKTLHEAAIETAAKMEATLSAAYDIETGKTELGEELRAVEEWGRLKAETLARRECNAATQAMAMANARACGITKARWIHVPGKYSSRETHIKFDRKEFNLTEGLYDPDVGKLVKPGELPYCACQFQIIAPGFNDEETE